MRNPDDKPSNCFILYYSQTFSTFTQYMTMSHGYSTIDGIEYGGCGEDKKGEDSLTSTRRINGLWRCPSIDINVSEQGLPFNGCTRAISVWKLKKKLSGCASNSLAHEDLGQFEEAHHIQAKFYNEKFPLVYGSDNI